MRISVEVVPRSSSLLISDLELIKREFPSVDTINIPDLTKFEMRSWDGCTYAKDYFVNNIPHIRAIDINLKEPLFMADVLQANGIKEVLVIGGDPSQDISRTIYPSTTCNVIKKIRREMPHLKVYAAIDQYRSSLKEEIDYAREKIDAGAEGFFFQPFFDLAMIEMYTNLIDEVQVFYGISPVTAPQSMNYWATKNNVVFPRDFAPTFDWNADFARKVLKFARENDKSLYFMPIRVDLKTYLHSVLSQV